MCLRTLHLVYGAVSDVVEAHSCIGLITDGELMGWCCKQLTKTTVLKHPASEYD